MSNGTYRPITCIKTGPAVIRRYICLVYIIKTTVLYDLKWTVGLNWLDLFALHFNTTPASVPKEEIFVIPNYYNNSNSMVYHGLWTQRHIKITHMHTRSLPTSWFINVLTYCRADHKDNSTFTLFDPFPSMLHSARYEVNCSRKSHIFFPAK